MVDNPFGTNISFLISEQIPEHIRQDNELYDLFMTAYYEWLELENNPLYMSEHLPEFTDIDKTPDYFFKQLQSEILANFPQDTLADKTLLIRFAKDFYERKGTLASYKFLFKALYNEDISISLPKDYILRASDGQWVVDNYILCQSIKGDPFSLIGDYIYSENGDALFVDNVILQNQGRYEVYKIYLPNATLSLDIDTHLSNKNKSVIVSTLGVIKNIEVINSGNNYQIGDYVKILDPYGVNGVARVKSLKPSNSISSFKIVNGGKNYRVGDQLVFTPTNGGFGAIAYVSKISNATSDNQCITTIESEQSVIADDVKAVKVEDYIKFQEYEVGSISEIKLVDGGREYVSMPTISIYQKHLYNLPVGSGANIVAVSKNVGQITEIEIIDHGVGYKKSDIYPIVDLTEIGDGTAVAKANVYSGVIQSGGYWKDNRGKLDSTVYLQDNYYYQNFSYVIQSSQPLNIYKNIVLENVHLSGTQLFGEVNINESVIQYPNEPYYNPSQWIQVVYDQYKYMDIKYNQLIKVNINKEMYYAELYGSIYYIKDFANYTPSLYYDMPLEDFKAIYQNLLLWDLCPIKLNDILSTPLVELYSSTRNSAYFAQPADVEVRKILSSPVG